MRLLFVLMPFTLIPMAEIIQRIRPETLARNLGKRFGRLVTIAFAYREGHEYFYVCRCDCGTEKNVSINCLRQTTRSCGCLGKEIRRKVSLGNRYRRLPAGEAMRNNLFAKCRLDAQKRGIVFELSRQEYHDLSTANCFYCGAPPVNNRKWGHWNGKCESNGIDRLDNSKGYVRSNCEPCCKKCNSLKNGITKEMVYRLYHRLFPQETEPSQRPSFALIQAS